MAAAELSREGKIREAKRLRDEGLTYAQISDRLDVGLTTAFNYVTDKIDRWKRENADKVRQQNLARNNYKRAWERDKASASPCGSQLSAPRAQQCADCVKDEQRREARERTERFIALREGGFRNVEIADREGVSPFVVATVFTRAHRYGLDAGRSPYFKAAS